MLAKDKYCMSSLVHEILKTKDQRAKNIKKKRERSDLKLPKAGVGGGIDRRKIVKQYKFLVRR